MFCDSKNDPGESRPNVNICPVCLGHPGTLPVMNREAVRHVLTVGLALDGTLADVTEFDRKNYFYPDIPKGYQISQYKHPLVSGGSLSGVAITRVHLEEDTATSLHKEGDFSLIDFNRAGVPLMELVTEPVIQSAKQAGDFARELQLLLRYLGASDANMEKGEMRVEANISVVRPTDTEQTQNKNTERDGKVLGTKVEVKNLNSFRAVERAIAYELNRQQALLESGEKVVQETRGWDEAAQKTFSQRRKEESHDYRYFPEPDLPKLFISRIPEFAPEEIRERLPELPSARRARFAREFCLKQSDAELFVASPALGALFETTAASLSSPAEKLLAANYISSDLQGLIRGSGSNAARLKFGAHELSELIRMTSKNELSSRGAKDLLAVMFERGGAPKELAAARGLLQKSDAGELTDVVKRVITKHPKVAADYKAGKAAALQFLVGQGMKATRGAGNPGVLKELFIKELA